MFRKLLLAVLCALLVPVIASAQSNAEPSLHVALNPCVLFSGNLAASTAVDIDTADVCGIPASATAVQVAVTVTTLSSGSLKLWEYDGTEPGSAVMTFGIGTASGFASPRTCAPWPECYHNVSAKSSAAVSLTLVAVGYYAPAE